MVENAQEGDRVVVRLMADGKVLDEKETPAGEAVVFRPEQPHRWSPEDPYLYDLAFCVERKDGKVLDGVKGYAALREVIIFKV